MLKGIITPCPELTVITNVAAAQFSELISAAIVGLQGISGRAVCSLRERERKTDCRLIWLIFHKAYKDTGHVRLFRLFVLCRCYTTTELSHKRSTKSTVSERNAVESVCL